MAMSAATLRPVLKAAIINEVQAKFPLTDATAIQVRSDLADAIAKAVADEVVAHIQANAVVTTTVSVVSVSGVTTGPSASGPGTGTGTGGVD